MNRNHRIGIVHTALALLMLAVLGRAAHVQLVQGGDWAEVAKRQHFSARAVPAPRGAISDANGKLLATSRELVKLEIAPREVRPSDARRLRTALVNAGVDAAVAARVLERDRRWLVVPDRFVADDIASITAMRGVYTTAVSERTYAISDGLRSLVGHVDPAGRGAEGLELALDSLLRGLNGASRLVRDVRGRMLATPGQRSRASRPGHTVILTINQELQEIAERALADAVARMDADGGDIVILDPHSGAVLALAGVRHGRFARSLTAVTEPFEPGSTLKPFIAAGLLARGKARVGDRVPARGGVYELHGRRIHDEPLARTAQLPGMLSLGDVIRYSSNVGIAQFAERYTPREQYETLRDFGLGTPTGIPYPSEASGTLRPPRLWSKQSSASLALGYEVSVTPLQLAVAYAALANGGELLQPALIKEVRSPDGQVRYRHERRVIRRVISPTVAATMRGLLAGVVEQGTAVEADMATYRLAGKTGTPRRTVDGRYAPMQYNPNFVGIFPADAPQLVVVVKLGSPRSSIYGGQTAAPVTKTILQAALAARDAALNRSALPASSMAIRQAGFAARTPVALVRRADEREILPDTGSRSVVLELAAKANGASTEVSRRTLRPVPEVRGMTLRDAVRSLHSAGFRVQLARGDAASSLTEPAAGILASPGSLVRLRYGH